MSPHQAFLILGIPEDATPEVAKRAYLKLLRTRRPETNPEGFRELREAYELVENLMRLGIRVRFSEPDESEDWHDDDSELQEATSAPPPAPAVETPVAPPAAPETPPPPVSSEQPQEPVAAPPLPIPVPAEPPQAARPDLDIEPDTDEEAPSEHDELPSPQDESPWAVYSRARAVEDLDQWPVVQQAFEVAATHLHGEPPPFVRGMEVMVELLAAGRFDEAKALRTTFEAWLKATGAEVTILSGHVGTWLLCRDLFSLVGRLPRKVVMALAQSQREREPRMAHESLTLYIQQDSQRADDFLVWSQPNLPALGPQLAAQFDAIRREQRIPPKQEWQPASESQVPWRVIIIVALFAVRLMASAGSCDRHTRSYRSYEPPATSRSFRYDDPTTTTSNYEKTKLDLCVDALLAVKPRADGTKKLPPACIGVLPDPDLSKSDDDSSSARTAPP